jgi:hypothetical protein
MISANSRIEHSVQVYGALPSACRMKSDEFLGYQKLKSVESPSEPGADADGIRFAARMGECDLLIAVSIR